MDKRATIVFAVLACAAASATPTASASPPPRVHGAMHWYRWHSSPRSLQMRAGPVGPTAVLGVTSMRELAPLAGRYGFRVLHTLPQLRAAEVTATRALVAGAAGDRR